MLSQSSMTYDGLDDLLTQTDYLTASTWMVTSNVYDGFNLVGTTVSDQSGKVLSQSSMTYDELDNLLTETDYLTASTYTVTSATSLRRLQPDRHRGKGTKRARR